MYSFYCFNISRIIYGDRHFVSLKQIYFYRTVAIYNVLQLKIFSDKHFRCDRLQAENVTIFFTTSLLIYFGLYG